MLTQTQRSYFHRLVALVVVGLVMLAGPAAGAGGASRMVDGDERWSPAFFANGTTGTAGVLLSDGQGRLYVGGWFDTAGDAAAGYVASWDGTAWHTLGDGIQGAVTALALAPDGSLYAGGVIGQAGGVAVNNVARWNGTSWTPLGSGVDGMVQALAVAPDGKLYAGGLFTHAGGRPASHVAMWNGSTWTALGSGVNGWVNALVVDGQGILYAGGEFSQAGGNSANAIARWTPNPTGGQWTTLGGGLQGSSANFGRVDALLLDGSGGLYAGGEFQMAGQVSAQNVAHWTLQNSAWQALGEGLAFRVTALALEPGGGRLFAGGDLSYIHTEVDPYVAAFDGAGWTKLGSGGPQGRVFSLLAEQGELFAAGDFSMADEQTAQHVARWDGSTWSGLPPFGLGMDGYVRDLAVDGQGRLFAGGTFEFAGPVRVNYLGALDGSQWHALNGGMNITVQSVAVGPDGSLYAGGYFNQAGGVNANYVAKWTGTEWQPLGAGREAPVDEIQVDSQGNLLVVSHDPGPVARWDGAQWSELGSGTEWWQTSLLPAPDGNLYAGGAIYNNGVYSPTLAMWDGAGWQILDEGAWVGNLAWGPDGYLYASGAFTNTQGVKGFGVARWDLATDGPWQVLGSVADPQFDQVLSLAFDAQGRLYVGGNFSGFGGISAANLARYDGTGWSALGSGTNGPVDALAVTDDYLYAGGGFTLAGGKPARYIARYWIGEPQRIFVPFVALAR